MLLDNLREELENSFCFASNLIESCEPENTDSEIDEQGEEYYRTITEKYNTTNHLKSCASSINISILLIESLSILFIIGLK